MSAVSTPLDRKPRGGQQQKGDLQLGAKATKSGDKTLYTESKGKSQLTRRRPSTKSKSAFDFDPQLVSIFRRNSAFFQRIFSLDTYLRPLPSRVAQVIARSVGSFTRIFTQFWDPRGIKNAQTAMGIRRDTKRVHRLANAEED